MKLNVLKLFILTTILSSCNSKETIDIEYKGANISENASIERDKSSKKAYLNVKVDGEWKLYSGSSVDNIDVATPVAQGDKLGQYALDVDSLQRSYFLLRTSEGQAILSDYHLPMEGGYNFRDMGGIRNKDGKYIKWGKVLRSDDLHNLTDADLQYLGSIPLQSIVDFRSKKEIEDAPDKTPATVLDNYTLSITPGNLFSIDLDKKVSVEDMEEIMKHLNELLVSDSMCITQYKTFFNLLQDEEKTPLLFHCSAGKDRTGMGAALFLSALNVDEDVIMNNYLESNTFLGDKYAYMLVKNPELRPMFEVKSAYIQTGLNYIEQEYGSINNYLTKVLDVDIKKMQELYLY